MKRINQQGVSNIMMLAFIIAFAGLASFALIRTFAAREDGTQRRNQSSIETNRDR